MISRLRGTILEKTPPQIILDVQGVGYEIDVSMNTFYLLPNIGENIELHTQFIVREDAHLLFGFHNLEEKNTFKQLLKVSGIGAKTALGILSALTPDELAAAILSEDVKKLSSAPSVGKKTAERMILELRGKLPVSGSLNGDSSGILMNQNQSNPLSHHYFDDVLATLLALGYNEKESRTVLKQLPNDLDVGGGVKWALKNLMR